MAKLQPQLSSKRGMEVRPTDGKLRQLITRITPFVLASPDSGARFFPARRDLGRWRVGVGRACLAAPSAGGIAGTAPSNTLPYVPWSVRWTDGIEYLDKVPSSSRARGTVRQVLDKMVEAVGPIHTARLAKLVCAEFDLNKASGSRAASVVKLVDRK